MDEPIAVIGSGGYVGARFVERAALLGEFRLVPIVRSVHSQGRLARYGARLARVDAADPASLAAVLKGSKAAVNLTVGGPGSSARDIRSIHEACRLAGVPLLVHMSTAEVFGRAESAELREESAPPSRHWMEYARDKAAAETWLRSQPTCNVSSVILRPGLIWGPGSQWLVRPAQELIDGTAYLFYGGQGVCNLIHVDNLINYVMQIVRSAIVQSGVFNVADSETLSWGAYYRAIAREVGADEMAIHMIGEHRLRQYRLRDGFSSGFNSLRNLPPVAALKRRVPPSTRDTLKRAIEGRIHPPVSRPQPYTPRPTINKGMWWIQGTVRKLPSGQIDETFPGTDLLPFPDLMAASGHWLRYAGFRAN